MGWFRYAARPLTAPHFGGKRDLGGGGRKPSGKPVREPRSEDAIAFGESRGPGPRRALSAFMTGQQYDCFRQRFSVWFHAKISTSLTATLKGMLSYDPSASFNQDLAKLNSTDCVRRSSALFAISRQRVAWSRQSLKFICSAPAQLA